MIIAKICSVEGCDRRHYSKGLCPTHYSADWHKNRPLYLTWVGMRNRCYNPNIKRYGDYGGRGIKVCPEWRESYEQFCLDMGSRPTPQHSIDRINNDGDYEPSNCRWTTTTIQALNKRMDCRNTSGIIGVNWDKHWGKWRAQIKLNHKTVTVGRFRDKQDAINARRAAEKKYYAPILNFSA